MTDEPLEFDAWALTVPVKFRIAPAWIRYSHHLFVRARSGETGWGGSVLYGRAPHQLARIFREQVLPMLQAAPAHVPAARSELADRLGRYPDIAGALDGALWELEAVQRGQSVARLLGGSEDDVPITEQLFVTTDEVAEREIRQARDRGVEALKVKVLGDPARDLRWVSRVRGWAGDDIALRLDANRGYTLRAATEVAPAYAALGIRQWEEPLDGSFADLRELRSATGLEVILDESVRSRADLSRAIDEQALDALNIKLVRVGGLTAALGYREACASAGVRITLGCNEDLGPGMAAILHAASAWRPDETEGMGWTRLGVDVADPSPEIRDGRATVPSGPGWGITCSPRLLSRHRTPGRSLRMVHHTEWGRAFALRSWVRRQHQRSTKVRIVGERLLARIGRARG